MMHDHCENPECGALLRAGKGVEFFGFDGWICSKCRWQLTYVQIEAIIPKPAARRKRWWRR